MNKSNIIIICFIILIISIAIYHINNSKVIVPSNSKNLYDKIYMINLEKRKDRLINFDLRYKRSDFKLPYELFKAIDGKKIDISKHITSKTLKEINDVERLGYRKYHYQLTRGAIGCYLSHVTIWKDILDNNIDKALIFEDDINIPLNGKQLIEYHTTNIPEDYDIILLGCNCLNCEKKSNYRIVKKFWGTYAYIITRKCIEKIYNRLFPIKQQIDSELSDLSNELNIYSTITNIIPHANIGKSDIQIPLNNTNILESFKNYQ